MIESAPFESLEDVKSYFASRSDLAPIPTPPADLWERLEHQTREPQKRPTSSPLPVPPAPQSLAIHFYPPARQRKSYALRPVKRIRATATPRRGVPRRRYPRPITPMSWKELL